MLKISEETAQSLLNYVAASRSDFPFGEVFKLTQQLMQLEKIEDKCDGVQPLNTAMNKWCEGQSVEESNNG